MVLPVYLAMSAAEMSACPELPSRFGYLACQFSPSGQGITNIPDALPEGAMLILTDRFSCSTHHPKTVITQLRMIMEKFSCESLLLDFQQPPEPEGLAMAGSIVEALPCPVAVSEGFADQLSCPVFLAPGALHTPLEQQLLPWKGREIWMEAALCQECITVTEKGTQFDNHYPAEGLEGGFYEKSLRCRYLTEIQEDRIRFTLFDTPESLTGKLEYAHSLGVSRAVGLYQELGCLFANKNRLS